ncbi:unnamed protein product [Linum trigynum]|uniref:Uncharacterized protein n=1 Tax=Linum trigynum TaxID=586398 RepID=A0AAV2FW31_9ROSI
MEFGGEESLAVTMTKQREEGEGSRRVGNESSRFVSQSIPLPVSQIAVELESRRSKWAEGDAAIIGGG